MNRYPCSNTGIRYVHVQGLGFPKDGDTYPHFDEQGVPSCTMGKCVQWSQRSIDGHPGGDCALVGSWLSSEGRQYCYPVIANAMAPLQLRLLRAYDNGRQDERDEVYKLADAAGVDMDPIDRYVNEMNKEHG